MVNIQIRIEESGGLLRRKTKTTTVAIGGVVIEKLNPDESQTIVSQIGNLLTYAQSVHMLS